MRAELLPIRKQPLESVRYAADRADDKVKFTDDALETILAVPPVFSGSVIFIMMMVLGLGSICTVLSILAVKLKKKGAAAMIISSIGFKNYVWFISLGYGFSIAGEGLLMLLPFVPLYSVEKYKWRVA